MSFTNLKAKAEKAAAQFGLSSPPKDPYRNPRRLSTSYRSQTTGSSSEEAEDVPLLRKSNNSNFVHPYISGREQRFYADDRHRAQDEAAEDYSDYTIFAFQHKHLPNAYSDLQSYGSQRVM